MIHTAPSFCPIIAQKKRLEQTCFQRKRQLASANVQKTLYNCSAWWYNLHLMETSRSGGAYHERRDADIWIPRPQCGKTVMGTRSVFALEASNAEVECACGKSALKVEFDGTEYHIYVPCGICGETHEAHCPPERVLRAPPPGCARRGNSAAYRPEGRWRKTCGIWRCWRRRSTQQQEDGEEAFVDNVIMYEILSELKDIAAGRMGITLRLRHGRYGMEIRRSAVDLIAGTAGQASDPGRHGPGLGRSLLPHEAGHSRREVTVSFYSQKERCKTV